MNVKLQRSEVYPWRVKRLAAIVSIDEQLPPAFQWERFRKITGGNGSNADRQREIAVGMHKRCAATASKV